MMHGTIILSPGRGALGSPGRAVLGEPWDQGFLFLLTAPDATGRGRTRGPVRRRTTRTGERVGCSMPTSRDGAPSASGVRGGQRIPKILAPRVRGVPLTLDYKRRRSAACCRHFHARPGRDRFSRGAFYNAKRQRPYERFASHNVLQRKQAEPLRSVAITKRFSRSVSVWRFSF